MHTIGRPSDCNAIASILIINWSRNCIHIISAEEECLSSKSSSEVECRMEVTFRCSSFTEIGHCDLVFTRDPIMIATSRSLWDLCAEWAGYSANVDVSRTVMNGHLLTTAQVMLISCQLVTHLLYIETTPEESTSLSILRKDHITIIDCSS